MLPNAEVFVKFQANLRIFDDIFFLFLITVHFRKINFFSVYMFLLDECLFVIISFLFMLFLHQVVSCALAVVHLGEIPEFRPLFFIFLPVSLSAHLDSMMVVVLIMIPSNLVDPRLLIISILYHFSLLVGFICYSLGISTRSISNKHVIVKTLFFISHSIIIS